MRVLHPKHLDMIGSELKFKYRSQERFKTGLGGCLTLLIIIAVLAALLSTIQSLILSPQPEVSISTKYSKKAPKIDLFDEEISLGLAMSDPLKGVRNHSLSTKYITVKAYMESLSTDLRTGAPIRTKTVDIPYKPCSEIRQKKLLKPFLQDKLTKQLSLMFGLCPEVAGIEESYFIQNKIQDPPMYSLNIFIYPCSLEKKEDCASLEEIARTNLYFTTLIKAFDPNNHTHPVTTLPEFDGILRLNPQSRKIMSNMVKFNEIWDDHLDFFDADLRLRYADYQLRLKDEAMRDPDQIHCTKEMIERNDFSCLPYVHFSFQSSGETTIIRRTYIKFFSSLGEVGGTAEILILLSVLLYSWYNRFFMNKFLKRELFGKEQRDQEKLVNIFEDGMQQDSADLPDSELGRPRRKNSLLGGFGDSHRVQLPRKAPNMRRSHQRRDRKKKEEQVMTFIEKNIQKNQDGVELYKKLNRLEILEKILLEEHDKVLVPLVLLNTLKPSPSEEILSKKKKTNKIGSQRIMDARRSQTNLLENVKTPKSKEMSIQEAYQSLKQYQPDSEIKLLIRDFMVKNLPPGIKMHQNQLYPATQKISQQARLKRAAPEKPKIKSRPKEPDSSLTESFEISLNRDRQDDPIIPNEAEKIEGSTARDLAQPQPSLRGETRPIKKRMRRACSEGNHQDYQGFTPKPLLSRSQRPRVFAPQGRKSIGRRRIYQKKKPRRKMGRSYTEEINVRALDLCCIEEEEA